MLVLCHYSVTSQTGPVFGSASWEIMMTKLYPPFRMAVRTDAPLLAELVNYAGEGLPLHLWEQKKEPGETAWQVGHKRAAREEGSFSYRNAVIIEHDGRAAGCLIGYPIPQEPDPIPDDMPAIFRPLQELENRAAGTWYVNVLAVLPEYRNLGLGAQLLAYANEKGRKLGLRGMSMIVSDDNSGARRLYERVGYRVHSQLPIVKDGWHHNGQNWILLTKMF